MVEMRPSLLRLSMKSSASSLWHLVATALPLVWASIMMSTAWRVDMRGMTLRNVATTCSIGVKSSLCRITLYGGSCVTRRSVSISIPGLVSIVGTLVASTLCKVGVPRNIISGPPYRFPRPKYRAQDGCATLVLLPDERQDLLEDLFGGAAALGGGVGAPP